MKNILYLLPALLLCVSCGDDFFSTTLKVDPPEYEEQMVIHAIFSDIDSILGANLSKTAALLDKPQSASDKLVHNATIEVFEEGQLRYTLDSIDQLQAWIVNYGTVSDSPIGGIGKEFEIKATHPTFGEISAVQKMPTAVPIVSARFKENAGLYEGERVNGVEITIQDPAGEVNFYEVGLANVDFGFSSTIHTFSNNPVATTSVNNDGLLISDETFDGKEFKIFILSRRTIGNNTKIIFQNITEDLFKYAKSVRKQLDSDDFGLFSEPVTVFSNTENGLGIFGLRTVRVFDIEF